LLGQRDQDYTLADTVFVAPPPHINLLSDSQIVRVCLGDNALQRWQHNPDDQGRLARWQLAHECVHLIDPHFPAPTNVLEEGLATWFQNRQVKCRCFFSTPAYSRAEHLVSPLMEDDRFSAAPPAHRGR
jgi:hypothetical protein